MNHIANTLRAYAENLSSAYDDCTDAMHNAADYIEQLEQELSAMHAKHPENSCYDVPTWKRLNAQIDTLAAQNEALREALDKAGKFIGEHCEDWYLSGDALLNNLKDSTLSMIENTISLPNLAAEVLKRRDAETLRRAAEKIKNDAATTALSQKVTWGEFYAVFLLNMAAELEKETT